MHDSDSRSNAVPQLLVITTLLTPFLTAAFSTLVVPSIVIYPIISLTYLSLSLTTEEAFTFNVSCADALPARGDAAWIIAPTPLSASARSSVTMSLISNTSADPAGTPRALKKSCSCWTLAPRATLRDKQPSKLVESNEMQIGRDGSLRADGVAGVDELHEDV